MFYFLLFIYILLAISFRRNRLLLFLLALQVLSLVGAIVINKPDYLDNPKTFFNVWVVLILNLLVILPWKKSGHVTSLICRNEKNWRSITRILLIISGFTFLILLVAAIVVNIQVSDVNAFKYKEGESMDFYYSMLPFDVHLFILACKLYTLSYILLPLHFYYLSVGNKRYALLCGLFSLNIVLYGMTFFSRWTILQYAFQYFAMWLMCSQVLSMNLKKKLKKIMGVVAIVAGAFFISISISRFTDNKLYELERIPSDSPIQNPTAYSFFDYLGQNNSSGMFLLNKYDGHTFGGSYAMSEIHDLFQGLRLVGESAYDNLRVRYWGEFAGGFSGWAAYTVYDFGYILAFLTGLIYYILVSKKGSKMTLSDFIKSSFLLQIPLCAIFYSWLSVVLFCYFIYFFIWLYLSLVSSRVNKSKR